MPKAKVIDRMWHKPEEHKPEEARGAVRQGNFYYDKCPECGEFALIHEGRCVRCLNCYYDKCSVN